MDIFFIGPVVYQETIDTMIMKNGAINLEVGMLDIP